MDFRKYMFGLALTTALLGVASPARAQLKTGPIDLQIFRPAADSKGYFTLNGAQVLAPLDVSFGLITTIAWKPLQLKGVANDDHSISSAVTVNNLITTTLQGAIGIVQGDHLGLQIGLQLPIVVLSGDATPTDIRDPNVINDDRQYQMGPQGIGDLVIQPKIRFINPSRKKIGVSLLPSMVLPTGDKNSFMGENQFIFQPSVVVDANWGRYGLLRTAINVGARIRTKGASTFIDNTDYFPRSTTTNWNAAATPPSGTNVPTNTGQGIKVGNEILAGLGAAWGLVPFRFDLVGEVYGFWGLNSKQIHPDNSESAMKPGGEAVVGIKLYLASNSFFEAGGGYQIMPSSYGAAKGRLFLGFIFEPGIGDRDGDGIKDDVDKCPDDPEDYDGFEDEDGCPDPDNDKDGIPDELDSCPNDPETYNGYKDEDGCPDGVVRDRDGDGIPDDVDKCPDEPEDFDGFEDEDGCPDPDNDKDGIPDKVDLCPNDPEDFDGFEDEDGCPDPDNDHDRIPDKLDKCPNEPETYNGFEDEDGCPDKGLVVVQRGKLEIMDKIYFETDKDEILPRSFPLLDQIAGTIKGHPEIKLIEVQGHADERGDDEHNLDLTDRRAKSVVRALEDRDVSLGRLRGKGYGETKPICTQHNEDCWSKNRRVEFIIIQRQDEQILQNDAGQ
jgi:outer membrane protein OmpA-like peptidoglycan-associated protein